MPTHSLYNGAVTLYFQARGHKYSLDPQGDDPVTSVTQVLSVIHKHLVWWGTGLAKESMLRDIRPGQSYDEIELEAIGERARKAHNDRKNVAANIGKIVHAYAEDYIHWMMAGSPVGKVPDLPVNPAARTASMAFLEWMEKHNVKPLISERLCYSRTCGYAGTVDLVAEVDGMQTVLDFKSSNKLYPETSLQVHAYAQALEEEGLLDKDFGLGVVRFAKDADDVPFEWKPIKWSEDAMGAFLAAQQLKKWLDGARM